MMSLAVISATTKKPHNGEKKPNLTEQINNPLMEVAEEDTQHHQIPTEDLERVTKNGKVITAEELHTFPIS